MPTCRLGNSFSEMYVGVEPNRDCVYGSCLRPMHRKLLQEAAMVTFVMMCMVSDVHRFLSFLLHFTYKCEQKKNKTMQESLAS